MAKKPVELGEGELAVMRVLWDHGPLTVRDVMTQLHERGRTVAYTTVMTFLTRLEQKGVVVSNKKDTAYVYRAKITRESVSASRIRSLLDQLYDGAAAPMLLQLIENERFSPEELAQLRKLINDLDPRPEHGVGRVS
jgi:BlaI family transcriptional regulator, penicillinase repressor